MGTTLTGTTPQDTYDSLIKVTDNGPISGTLKALSDGLGNDSTLSLSTTAASIAGTLAVSGAATFDTTTLVVDATNNRVGVGVASPTSTLDVSGTLAVSGNAAFDTNVLFVDAANNRVGIGTVVPDVKLSVIGPSGGNAIYWSDLANNSGYLGIRGGAVASVGADNNLVFETASTERMRITTDSYVRLASGTGGIQFNGDTAAANALDDYEEGTWTMGVEFGGASAGVTTSLNTGKYTKIGRQVTVTGLLVLTSKGSSTGDAKLTGLPFPVGANSSSYSTASVWYQNVSFVGQFSALAANNESVVQLFETSALGAVTALTNGDFANNSEVIISLTYFV